MTEQAAIVADTEADIRWRSWQARAAGLLVRFVVQLA